MGNLAQYRIHKEYERTQKEKICSFLNKKISEFAEVAKEVQVASITFSDLNAKINTDGTLSHNGEEVRVDTLAPIFMEQLVEAVDNFISKYVSGTEYTSKQYDYLIEKYRL